MNEFQVGDRVRTIVGTVAATPSCFKVAVDYGDGSRLAIYHTDYIELVERPKRKLRVGSVWECENMRYTVVTDRYLAWVDHHGNARLTKRDLLSFDASPSLWREVPVEQLDREAQ